ncbi:galactose-3-O-sulfotransferase 2-like [Liolophura sinensis]|uniref:galactose-3-O-sulfotransferase 2-like n=1 Tax=Liolophura sinensis TaxID=3198878 RepID=UPI0031585F89
MRMSRKLWYTILAVLVVYLFLQARQLVIRFKDEERLNRYPNYPYASEKLTDSKCSPRTNIAFVKTHKTGSTTFMNILQRFGFSRDLTFILPRQGLVYLGPHRLTLNSWSILPRPVNKTFNILCNHVVYNKDTFHRFLPNDTVYISILRHPLRRFLSAFWYYSHVHPQDYLLKIKGDNKVQTFLQNPSLFEAGVQYTNNAMATDLGLSPVNFHQKSEIMRYICDIDRDFTQVLILELFDESLILLKRKLCWDLGDILYLPKNERTNLDNSTIIFHSNLTKEDIHRHEIWDQADFQFYNHFKQKLMQEISSLEPHFSEEVLHFKQLRKTVSSYCQQEVKHDNRQMPLSIPESAFNRHIVVTPQDCELLLIRSEERFTEILIHKQYPDLQHLIFRKKDRKGRS